MFSNNPQALQTREQDWVNHRVGLLPFTFFSPKMLFSCCFFHKHDKNQSLINGESQKLWKIGTKTQTSMGFKVLKKFALMFNKSLHWKHNSCDIFCNFIWFQIIKSTKSAMEKPRTETNGRCLTLCLHTKPIGRLFLCVKMRSVQVCAGYNFFYLYLYTF